VADHSRGDEKHQDEIDWQRIENACCLKVVGGERCEVGESPTAADAATGEDPVCGSAFKPYAPAEEEDADGESAEDFAARAPSLELPSEE
jgi:hypothetical protein